MLTEGTANKIQPIIATNEPVMINGLRTILRSETIATINPDIPAQTNGGTDNNCDLTVIWFKE